MYHNKAEFINAYLQKFQSLHGKGVDEGSNKERYEALAGLVRDMIAQKWARTNKQYLERGVKQVYYFSIEYLQGRILITNLLNLDLLEMCTEGLGDLGISLAELTEQEPEAGLGSGGLGRLASCFLDSIATATACSSRRSSMATRLNCRTPGCATATPGSSARQIRRWS